MNAASLYGGAAIRKFVGIAISVAVAVFAAFKSYPVDYDEAGKLLVDGAKMAKDTYKWVGWCVGFLIVWFLEKRYVNFSTNIPLMTRITTLLSKLPTKVLAFLLRKMRRYFEISVS
ncbi:MAG: hypothetical protein J6A07_01405 [Firmicutes bacterium]|nr:hypothetical protein [Bacillota bacterium]